MNHPVLMMLASMLAMLQEAMPDMIDRLPGAQVQKFRDLIEQIEKACADPYALGLHDAPPADGGLPPFISDVIQGMNAELARRAEFDDEQAGRSERIALAVEMIAASLEQAKASGSI